MGPAFVITQDGGTNEISRIHFFDDHFLLGSYGNDRVGPFNVYKVEVIPEHRVTLYATDGRCQIISWAVVSGVTFRPIN